MFHNGQAQPRAAGLARAALVDPIEALGESTQMLRLNARPIVFHHKDSGALRTLPPTQANLAPGRCVANGIAHQVAKGTGKFVLIAQKKIGLPLGQWHDKNLVALATEHLGLVGQPVEHCRHVNALLLKGLLRRLKPREQEQVIDEALHALGL